MTERDPEALFPAGEVDEESGFAGELRNAPLPELAGYEILRRLDSGGQGTVYSAYQANTGRRVAIKILRESGGDTRLKEERLRREARFLSRLHHPNIVTIQDVGSANNQVYLVTDFIDGVPIDDHVNLSAAGVREIVELVVKVCDAMAVAHASGVIHRDLKPRNIVVDENNQPYVLDFGLAQSLEDNLPRLSETDAVVGTVEYLPPERITGHHPDTRSDVYAMGLILYECIADQLPFSGDNRAAILHAIVYEEPLPLRLAAAGEKLNPNTAPSNLPRDLESVVMKAIARNVDERYQSAADMGADLRRFLNDEPVLARSTSTGYMLRRILRRYRVHVTAACMVLIMLVGSLLAVTTAWRYASYAAAQATTALQMAGMLHIGSVGRGRGQIDTAMRQFQEAINLAGRVNTEDPLTQEQLYNAHHRYAELLYSEESFAAANEHARDAIAIADRSQQHSPDAPVWIRKRAFAQILRAKIAFYGQDFKTAAIESVKAADRYRNLASMYPDEFVHRADLAYALSYAANAFGRSGRDDEAFDCYRQSMETYHQLIDDQPKNVNPVIDLANTQNRVVYLLLKRDTPKDNTRALNTSIEALNLLQGVHLPERQHDIDRIRETLETNRETAQNRLLR